MTRLPRYFRVESLMLVMAFFASNKHFIAVWRGLKVLKDKHNQSQEQIYVKKVNQKYIRENLGSNSEVRD